MKSYRFENAPLLKAFSKRPGSDNELDRRRVNLGPVYMEVGTPGM